MINKKILIIEDEENISDILSHYLQNEGFKTRVANCGNQGLQFVQEFLTDLILLDLMLPDIDGFEVCKRISVDNIILIIMITAKSYDVDKILGMELGADDYITKPFNIREVIMGRVTTSRVITPEIRELLKPSLILYGPDLIIAGTDIDTLAIRI